MVSDVSTEKPNYREVGMFAYKSCSNPITQVDLIMGDIRRMPHEGEISPGEYRKQLLGGFRDAARDAGDRDTVGYVDKILSR